MGKRFFTENWIEILLASCAGVGTAGHAASPTGIIGGQSGGSNAYAALVSNNGALTPIAGLPENGEIYGTAINLSGLSLIGGYAGANGYVATVSPTGTLTPLSLSFLGTIYTVAINQGDTGLIGGYNNSFTGFAALIAPDGTITTPGGFSDIPGNTHYIIATAINDASVGLIGGEGNNFDTFAAYVALDGTVTPITLPSDPPGEIASVAVNTQGVGIIGGFNGNGAYAAFVTPTTPTTPLVLSPLPNSGINSVAINDAGIGLIGGDYYQDPSYFAFAGYSTAEGAVTPLLDGAPFVGSISSVAMNASGTGLIGGQNGSDLYAALVKPDISVTPVIAESIAGQINWVAINDAGIGLIGGINNATSEAYAALVAPNGSLTLLNPSATAIANVAITDVNAATPRSFGPYLSVAYTQLAASYALESLFIGRNGNSNQVRRSEVALLACNEDELLASNSKRLPTKSKPKRNSIWVAPFGDYVHLKEQGAIPNYTNEIGGVLVAYDHEGPNYVAGTCLGYAFNYVGYGKGLGHGKVQEEMACGYGSYLGNHFRVNGALWGGLYQFWNTRHTLSLVTSKAMTHGWILSPHLEMATPWALDLEKCYLVEPFFTLDWVNSWQKHFTESGKAGFNLKMPALYSSLLQSEVGLRFYERFTYGWGNFCLEEKVSYVNQAPFHVNSVATSFVGAVAGFPIAVASTKVENLGALQLTGSFTPKNDAYPYGGFSLQAMANGSYQSYFASVFSGIKF